MAIIKLDELIDTASGKVGGQSFVSGSQGVYIRNNAQTKKGFPNLGVKSKIITPILNAKWQGLSPTDQTTYMAQEGSWPFTNRVKELQQYTGYQIFMLCAQGRNLINENVRTTASAFQIINKPEIEIFINNSDSFTVVILNPQNDISYAIYATQSQNVGVYSVRKFLRYLGFVDNTTAKAKFDISAIYKDRFNSIELSRNYGVLVKPIYTDSGQIGPSSDIAVKEAVFVPTPPPGTNTFIYGIASIAPNKTALSTLIGCPVINIVNFVIIGDDVFAEINAAYAIPSNAFNGNSDIIEYVDQDGFASINSNLLFANTINLIYVEFPNATTLAGSSFTNSGLATFSLPNLVSSGFSSFRNTNIIVADLPSYATTLSNSCFADCSLLEEVLIASLTAIENEACLNCIALHTFPSINNIAVFSTSCFRNTPNLALNLNSSVVTTINISAFEKSGITSLIAPNVVNIANSSFLDAVDLTTITLASCTFLGVSAFRNTSASTYDFPLVTSVGFACFRDCANADVINLNSVTSLGNNVFDNSVFFNIKINCTITVPIAMATINSGAPDGDLVYAATVRSATIIYV